jgi:hypothetical protein
LHRFPARRYIDRADLARTRSACMLVMCTRLRTGYPLRPAPESHHPTVRAVAGETRGAAGLQMGMQRWRSPASAHGSSIRGRIEDRAVPAAPARGRRPTARGSGRRRIPGPQFEVSREAAATPSSWP